MEELNILHLVYLQCFEELNPWKPLPCVDPEDGRICYHSKEGGRSVQTDIVECP